MSDLNRRRHDQLIEQAGGDTVSALFDVLADLHEKIERLDAKIDRHISEEESRLLKVESAFPDGDPGEHRKYHEALMRKIEARTAFWQKLTFELVKVGVLGLLGWALLQLWPAFLKGPK